MFKRVIIPILIVAAGFGTMRLLSSFKKEQKRMPPHPFIRTVATQKIHYATLPPTIEAIGRVSSLERISLTPEVSGLILASPFKLYKGQSFKKGEILFRIDSSQVYFGFSSTVSDLQNAVAGLMPELATDHPEALPAWQKFFSDLSVAALPDLPSPGSDRVKLLATRYGVYKLYFLALQQRNTLEKHTIRAPFTGTVEETQVFPASMARAGVAVATIVRTDAMEVELALTGQQLPFIKNNMHATVTIGGVTEPKTGTVHRISDILDEQMQTASAFVRINGTSASGYRSGTYAEVRFTGIPIDHAVAIPRKALHDKSFVYTISADTLAEADVEIACLSVDSAYITSGLDDGSVLVAEPLQEAVIGMAVQDLETARARQAMMKSPKNRNGVPSDSRRQSDKKRDNAATSPSTMKSAPTQRTQGAAR